MDFAKEVLKRTAIVLSSIIVMGLYMFICLMLIIWNVYVGAIFTLVTISVFIAYMDLKRDRSIR